MTARLETSSDAREAARVAVAYLDENERWALLQRWLAKETPGRRKATRRSFRLEALRGMVCPMVNDREWDTIVRDHRPERWAHELRLVNATTAAVDDQRQPIGS
jgi:hypothetical protein